MRCPVRRSARWVCIWPTAVGEPVEPPGSLGSGMTFGILALQGDVREHARSLHQLGCGTRPVRRREDLDGLKGLVLPGGESTTLSRLLVTAELFEPLAEAIAGGLPVMGTCAGMILLAARVVEDGDIVQFGAIDLLVRRNGYGAQASSFEGTVSLDGGSDLTRGGDDRQDEKMPAVFIRAPVIEEVGPGVEVVARLSDGQPVACRQKQALVASFHPELTTDLRFHRMFVALAEQS